VAVAGRTVGVEEEFLLVDPVSGQVKAVGGAVLQAAEDDSDLTAELQREQIETGTRPTRDLAELGHELYRTRAHVRDAARAVGVEPVALATYPLPVDPTTSSAPRSRRIVDGFGLTGSEQLTCGCHVHVGIDSEEEGVAAIDRIRPWLAPLLAISANSPFWDGVDSGYASFRGQVWERWPSAGSTELFGSAAGYRDVVQAMLDTQTLFDGGMIYFDARLSRQHPTLEVRVADVCREPDDALLLAALTRALVETAVRQWQAGGQPDPVRLEVLRLASWRAARSGLDAELLDPSSWRPALAADVVSSLVDHVSDALDDAGDRHTVDGLVSTLLRRGTGATRQREVYKRTADLRAVIIDAARTHSR
jgi:glutamate---cysteine ligase / carboxylate-amine ligase